MPASRASELPHYGVFSGNSCELEEVWPLAFSNISLLSASHHHLPALRLSVDFPGSFHCAQLSLVLTELLWLESFPVAFPPHGRRVHAR
jgi:hypothetical protein